MQGTLDEAAAAMNGRLEAGRGETRWTGAALDSRRVAGGELFFALPGEQTDGHRFATAALSNGAAAAVVHQPVPDAGPRIEVDDTFAALHDLTRWARRRAPRHLVAVTGSAGKTTTKELLAAMLARRFRSARSPGNLNNLYGFPLALLGIPDDTEWMVAEMGMSLPGELAQVSRLGRPDVVVLTNIGRAHLEKLGSIEAVAAAKEEILEGLAPDGWVVANFDDPRVVEIVRRRRLDAVGFALAADADHQAEAVEEGADGRCRFLWRGPGFARRVELGLYGAYNATNFLAAAACAHRLGVAPEEIAAAAAAARPGELRGVVRRAPAGAVVVDDSYNSNPDALERALASARALAGERHWAVLGAMLELGADSPALHREAGRRAAALGFSPVLGVGEEARELAAAAAAGGAEVEWCEDAAAAAAAAGRRLRAGDVILVKGSRGIGLELVVERLLAAPGGGGGR